MARLLAKKLGILYLDTGAMYRAVALKAVKEGLDRQDESALAGMLERTDLEIVFGPQGQAVLLDGQDVTEHLRTEVISLAASEISAHPVVRRRLVQLQRELAGRQDLVLEGRDIGSYVLPDASIKFYLSADPKERARRRLADLRAQGDQETGLDEVLEQIIYRDEQDKNRAMAPLVQAEDAILVDSTGLAIEEVISLLLELVRQRQGQK